MAFDFITKKPAKGIRSSSFMNLPAITAVARDKGVVTMIDNTWSSPYFCQPIKLGVDVVIEACTKYVVGHSDVMIGTSCANKETWPAIENMAGLLGHTAGPDDVYLAQRGMRTLSVRLKQHWENGLKIAQWLKNQDMVDVFKPPALPDDQGHTLW